MVHDQGSDNVSNNEKNEMLMDASKKISKDEKQKLRNFKKKQRRKHKERQKLEFIYDERSELQQQQEAEEAEENNKEGVEIEYVERDEYLLTGQYYEQFKKVFQFFQQPAIEQSLTKKDDDDDEFAQFEQPQFQQAQEQQNGQDQPLSKKKRKQLQRLKVAQLKALVKRPDLVEGWDIASKDPLLLIFLKSYKNTVAVPQHWSQKRKFLQNKRGILKTQFQLPENVEATGIAKLRDPMDRDGAKMVRQKLRERMNPKLGKIDIDYEVLHDAFFKHQKKSDMTIHGDIYFEGKENEVKMKNYRPGRISDALRQALGIAEYASPPWIINMQRYGPPPSYPNLKIPGLNTPLVDSYGHSMFGQRSDKGIPLGQFGQMQDQYDDEPVDQTLWGIAQEQIIEEESDEEEQEPMFDPTESQASRSEINDTRSVTGTLSTITGIDTPTEVEIRKKQNLPTFQQPPAPIAPSHVPLPNNNDNTNNIKLLYQILETVENKGIGKAVMGSTIGYIIPQKNEEIKKAEPKKEDKKQENEKKVEKPKKEEKKEKVKEDKKDKKDKKEKKEKKGKKDKKEKKEKKNKKKRK